MSDEPRDLDGLLDSVSEGRDVDWTKTGAGEEDQPRVAALREVARIADFNRALQRPPGASPAGERRWGPLLLLELLGTGATGEVWRAWDPQLEREIALKLLQSGTSGPLAGDLSPLLDEGRALARVRHPNVVALHGIETHEGRTGLRMEFVRGATLEQRIAERGALAPDEAARMGVELARALAAVHAAGLVHRDVKPANVVIETGGRLVLTDFGLGQRRFLAANDAARVTGTPLFMPPERLRGEIATERGDLYGAGVTLWCALAGRHPFVAGTLAELRQATEAGPRPGLRELRPELPPALLAIVERAMAPRAEDRFASAAELADALERCLARTPDAAPRTRAGRPGLALALAAMLGMAAIGAWWFTRPRPVAVTSPPATAAPDPAQAPYAVEAALVRHDRDGVRRLANGDRVRPGDRLSLQFHATRPAYVYVLNEDERGESFLLFPQPVFDQANPLPATSTLTLPGTIGGAENAWTVTSRGGREHFLVVASPEPVAELEAQLARLPAARPGRPVEYAAVPPAAVERLRGVGGVAPVPVDDTPHRAGTFDRFRALADRESGVRGTWVRQITLENPLR